MNIIQLRTTITNVTLSNNFGWIIYRIWKSQARLANWIGKEERSLNHDAQ